MPKAEVLIRSPSRVIAAGYPAGRESEFDGSPAWTGRRSCGFATANMPRAAAETTILFAHASHRLPGTGQWRGQKLLRPAQARTDQRLSVFDPTADCPAPAGAYRCFIGKPWFFAVRPRRQCTASRGKDGCQRSWQGLGDSNPRPSVLETDALPTELNPSSSVPVTLGRIGGQVAAMRRAVSPGRSGRDRAAIRLAGGQARVLSFGMGATPGPVPGG